MIKKFMPPLKFVYDDSDVQMIEFFWQLIEVYNSNPTKISVSKTFWMFSFIHEPPYHTLPKPVIERIPTTPDYCTHPPNPQRLTRIGQPVFLYADNWMGCKPLTTEDWPCTKLSAIFCAFSCENEDLRKKYIVRFNEFMHSSILQSWLIEKRWFIDVMASVSVTWKSAPFWKTYELYVLWHV